MSLELSLAVLAEGAANDSRGSITLVAVNPHALIVDQFPAQVAPIFFVVIEDTSPHADRMIAPGRTFDVRLEAKSLDDGQIVFFAQFRQPVVPTQLLALNPRVQVTAQLLFTAAKAGDYEAHARVAVVDEEQHELGVVDATRTLKVADMATLKQGR